jgi:hypothetical protein
VSAAADRLAQIAGLLAPCPLLDIAGGWDRCGHGAWPCAVTPAAWLAQGRDRDHEARAACQAAAEQEAGQADWKACQDHEAAQRDGRLPYGDAGAQPEAG